jgi:hypothetical protein
MTAQATIRLHADGRIGVEPFIRLTDDTNVMCCTYDDQAPIVAIDDGNVSVSITVPDVRHVTRQDVNRAMKLADAVARYIAELGEHLADEDSAAPDEAA